PTPNRIPPATGVNNPPTPPGSISTAPPSTVCTNALPRNPTHCAGTNRCPSGNGANQSAVTSSLTDQSCSSNTATTGGNTSGPNTGTTTESILCGRQATATTKTSGNGTPPTTSPPTGPRTTTSTRNGEICNKMSSATSDTNAFPFVIVRR